MRTAHAPGWRFLRLAAGPEGAGGQGDDVVLLRQYLSQVTISPRREAIGVGQVEEGAPSAKVVE